MIMADENKVVLSQEEYSNMLQQLEAQNQILQTMREMQQQMKEMQEQMNMFSLHFGQIYAAQTIEETLQSMGSLGKAEIGAERCTVYSVDPFDNTRMFTANKSGEREYFSPSDESFFTQAIQNKESLILNGEDGETLLFVPLENQSGEIIGLATAQGKEGGFTHEDIDAFNLQNGKIGNAFRIGLENKALYQKATTDKLTLLQNREGMEDFVKSQALSCLKQDKDVSVVMFDIDHFKRFNDEYGHDIGDKCLKQVAETLHDNIRQNANSGVFRWGGEEMVAILPVNQERAAEIADRLRKAVENKPLRLDNGETTKVTISGGVAQFDKNASLEHDSTTILDAFENVLKEADTALYRAKGNGRNQIARSDGIAKDEQVLNTKDLAHFEMISQYDKDVAQQEYLFAQDVMKYLHGDAISSDFLFSECAEEFENPENLKDIIRTLDKFRNTDLDVNKTAKAEELRNKAAELQQAQMESLNGKTFTDKECLEMTVNHSINDDAPFVKFGRYSAVNENEGDCSRSLLHKDNEPVALLTVDKESKSALLEFALDDNNARSLNAREIIEVVDAYQSPMQAMDLMINYPEDYGELDFWDIDPARDISKDGDIYRINFSKEDEETLANRIGLVGDFGDNVDLFVENGSIYADYVDRNDEPIKIPLDAFERESLKDVLQEHDREIKKTKTQADISKD